MSEFTKVFADWHRKEITIYTPTRTVVRGEQLVTWAAATANVFIDQARATQRYGDSNISDEADYVITCETTISVSNTDVISFDGRFFEVLPTDNVLFQEAVQEIEIREVTNKPDGI